jgi:hypothetical protein
MSNDVSKLNAEREILNHDKDVFLKVNFMLNSNIMLNNFNQSDEKVKDINKKVSINTQGNVTLPTGLTNSLVNNSSTATGSYVISNPNISYSQSLQKKEIVKEKPGNYYSNRTEFSREHSNSLKSNPSGLMEGNNSSSSLSLNKEGYNTISNV